MGKRIGMKRLEAILENLNREINWGTKTTHKHGNLKLGASSTIFEWNYISCPTPIVSNIGSTAHGVLADGELMSMIFPGPSGEMYPAQCSVVGAYTAAGGRLMVEGTIPASDTNLTAAGFNLQGDAETADNTGIEIIPGGTAFGGASACTIGTHAMTFDATFYNVDWTDYDAVTIGFRKVEEFETGHGAILAAASGDALYTDFVAFGCQSADDVQIAHRLNDGTSTYTDSTQATAADKNHRFHINVTKAGVVTYSHVGAQNAGEGTLAAPSTTAAFTFDSGDTVVPYIIVQGTNANSAVYLKDIKITRSLA